MNEQDKARIAEELGIPPGYEDMLDNLTIEEIKTRRCEGCERVLQVHEDARWRFRLHAIRCDDCAAHIREVSDYSMWESYYVC